MNRVQIGVLGTAAFLGVAIFGLTRQAYDKHDLLGVIPGMTYKQAESLSRSRKWTCQDQPAAHEAVCSTSRGNFTLQYLPDGDQPISRATLELTKLTDTAQVLADDLSGQYRKQPARVEGQEPVMTFTWDLGGGITLQLQKTAADKADLVIENESLQKRRDSAGQGAPK